MEDQSITCPNCKCEIQITKVITDQIRGKLQLELEAESQKKNAALLEKENILKQQESELEKRKAEVDTEISKKLQEQTELVKAEAEKKAREALAVKVKGLEDEVSDNKKKLAEAQKAELEFLKEKRLLEEKREAMELEMARALDTEREKIKAEALIKFQEDHQINDKQKDILIEGLRRDIEDLKKRADQGSNVSRGEALEQSIEETLKSEFPRDDIKPISQGKKGADVLQTVCDEQGRECGMILWESKNTSDWSNRWIGKLKEDKRDAKADIAIILSMAMPKGVNDFGYIEGVWVTDHKVYVGIARILRMSLMEVAKAKRSNIGKDEKVEAMYQYLTGPEFSQRIEAIIDPFLSMKKDLDREKAAMIKIWAKREKELDKVINNASGLYGDLESIAGAQLPELKSLDLMRLNPATDDEE